MNADRHNPPPRQRGNTAADYLLALRQLTGVVIILFLSAIAWLLVHLPLPTAYIPVVGYGAGLALFIPGALLATRGRIAGKTLLGGGASFVFLTTTTVLFEETPHILPFHFPLHPYSSLLICLALLFLFATLSWRAQSESNSLLTVALAAYMLYSIAPQTSILLRGIMLFVAVLILAAWLCLWTAYRSERLFTHWSLFLGYGAIYAVGRSAIDGGGISLGLVAAALTLLYVMMTTLAVDQALRDHARHRIFLFFAVANVLLYGAVGFALFSSNHILYLWTITVAVFAASAVAALVLYIVHDTGALISTYTATAIVAMIVCFLMPFAPGPRLMVLTACCLAPALTSHWRNDRLVRLTEYGLLAVVVITSFFLGPQTGYIHAGFVGITARWAWLLASVGLLCLLSILHTGWIFDGALNGNKGRTVAAPGYHPEQELLALAYAFGAALLSTTHTILLRGDSEALPPVLSAQGMVFLGLGMAFFTPALALAGLAPVIAGHAIFYAFPYLAASPSWAPPEESLQQIIALSGATILLALYADRLLVKRLDPPFSLSERVLAFIPYLPALALLLLVAHETLPVYWVPPVMSVLALALLLPLRRQRPSMPGIRMLGFAIAAISALLFVHARAGNTPPAYLLPWYLPLLAVYVGCLILLERLASRRILPPYWKYIAVSHLITGAIAVIGAVGIYRWNNSNVLLPALLGFALLLTFFGRLFRARAYYHVALALTVLVAGVAFFSAN